MEFNNNIINFTWRATVKLEEGNEVRSSRLKERIKTDTTTLITRSKVTQCNKMLNVINIIRKKDLPVEFT